MTDTHDIDPGADARLTAALDQLLAAISAGAGTQITQPVIILARLDPGDGLVIFHVGLPDGAVGPVLEAAIETWREGPPDVRFKRPL